MFCEIIYTLCTLPPCFMLDWLEVPPEVPSHVEPLYPSTTPRTAPSKLWIIAQQSILMVAVPPKLGRIQLGYRFL
jgi:hypothetical protein